MSTVAIVSPHTNFSRGSRSPLRRHRKKNYVTKLLGFSTAVALTLTLFQATPARADSAGVGDIFADGQVAFNYAISTVKKQLVNKTVQGECQATVTLHWNATGTRAAQVNAGILGAMKALKSNGNAGPLISSGAGTLTYGDITTNANDACPSLKGHNGSLAGFPSWAKDWLAEGTYLLLSLTITAGMMGIAATFAPALLTSPWFDGVVGCLAGAVGNTAYLLILGQSKWTEALSGVVSGCVAGALEVAGIRGIAHYCERMAATVERAAVNQGIMNSSEIDQIMNGWLVEMQNL